MGFGGTSWKEEVLLHDGSTFIVKRSQSYSLNRLQSSTNSRIYQAAQDRSASSVNRAFIWK
jgi:hypothetical protein